MEFNKKLSEYFKEKANIYHYVLMFILQISIYFSSFHIYTFSLHKRMPDAICIKVNSTEPALACNENTFCDTLNYQRHILYDSSLDNWSLKYELYCENEIYLRMINSLMFVTSMISGSIMTPLTEKFGRLPIFRLEISLILIGNLIIFFSDSLTLLFAGIVLCFLGNHITILSTIYFREFFESKLTTINYELMNFLFSIFGILLGIYVKSFNNLYYLYILLLIMLTFVFYSSFKLMMETPVWLEKNADPVKGKTDEKNALLISNFNYILELSDDDKFAKDTLREQYRITMEDLAIHAETAHTITNNQNDQSNIQFFTKNFFICIYLWVFNQAIFYTILLNLDSLDSNINYSFEIFYIANLISNSFSIYFFDKYGGKFILQFTTCLSAILCYLIYHHYGSNLNVFQSMIFFFFIIIVLLSGNLVYTYVGNLFNDHNSLILITYSKLPSKLFLFMIPFIINPNKYLFLFLSIVIIIVPIIMIFSKEKVNKRRRA